MATALGLAIVVLGLGQNPEKMHVPNLLSIVGADWTSQSRWDRRVANVRNHGDVGMRTRMLSLRPSLDTAEPTLATGIVWFWDLKLSAEYSGGFKPTRGNVEPVDYADDLAAYKGVYKLYLGKENSVLLKVGFTRRYQHSFDGGQLNWTLDTRWMPEGADLVLPLDDNGAVPDDQIELLVERFYYVDGDGHEMVRRYEPETFKEKIIGHGEIRKLFYLSVADNGEVIRFQKKDAFRKGFESSPPPTFRFRQASQASSSVTTVTTARPVTDSSPQSTASQLFEKAKEAYAKKDYDRTVLLCTTVIELEPNTVDAFRYRGYAYESKLDFQKAGLDYSAVLRFQPRDDSILCRRALMYEKVGCYQRAFQDLKTGVGLRPDGLVLLNRLAWLLATCPDSRIRNGTEAITFAEKACHLTEYKDPVYLDTLAAAHAEAGQFQQAIRWQTIAVSKIDAEWKDQAANRLTMYQSHTPYHEK